jgi:hypothetical protein
MKHICSTSTSEHLSCTIRAPPPRSPATKCIHSRMPSELIALMAAVSSTTTRAPQPATWPPSWTVSSSRPASVSLRSAASPLADTDRLPWVVVATPRDSNTRLY